MKYSSESYRLNGQCLLWWEGYWGRALFVNNLDNNSNANGNNNLNNSGSSPRIAQAARLLSQHRLKSDNLYVEICSNKNLLTAFERARKGKTTKDYVLEFETNLQENIFQLRNELLFHTYRPQPLKTFVIRDPKTRKISKSAFRDRIVHHAICNILGPLFERSFIYDSYANRKGKSTLKAISRFDIFKRKVSHNFTRPAFVLKADIKQYFETVDKSILLSIIKKRVHDEKVLWLLQKIFSNYETAPGKGMPLGNLTSQFFANVYLNELDQFVKHQLRVKYYIRYVDDFVLFHTAKEQLEAYKTAIGIFLRMALALQLHPLKSRIIPLQRGTEFLGLKIFPYHKLLKKKNLRRFEKKFSEYCRWFEEKLIGYDEVYDFLEGWIAYAQNANTYTLRKTISRDFEEKFAGEVSTKECNRYQKEFCKNGCR